MRSRPTYYPVFLVCFFILAITLRTSAQKTKPEKPEDLIESLMKKYPEYFGNILQNRDSLRVQIIYTQINRSAQNKPSFTNYYFDVNDSDYFYPASTVKMPVALLALQKIHELRIPGLDKNIAMITESEYSGQSGVLNDPTSKDGKPSIAQYVKKIFLVSDNDAFNRLYEFSGQEYINKQLMKMGYKDTEIRHRLQISLTPDENSHTNPISFFDEQGNVLYRQPMQVNQQKFSERNDFVGKGYYSNGTVINHPMDFSHKNRIGLQDLHNILKSIIFPEAVPEKQKFNLSDDDYKLLYQYMSQYPAETKYPSYDTLVNRDAYCKFLYWGSDTGRLPKDIRIFNKVGDAYGFLTDVSYFVDFNKKIEFMLSATIYCNKDGILSDDKYDYDKVGYPFMKQLGRMIYQYELKRKKKFMPDLSKFKIQYDKSP